MHKTGRHVVANRIEAYGLVSLIVLKQLDRLQDVRVRAKDDVYAQLTKEFGVGCLLVRGLHVVLDAPVRAGNDHLGTRGASLLYVGAYLVLAHIRDIGGITRPIYVLVGGPGIVEDRNLESVLFHHIDVVYVVLGVVTCRGVRVVDPQNRHLGIVGLPVVELVGKAFVVQVEGMVGCLKNNVKTIFCLGIGKGGRRVHNWAGRSHVEVMTERRVAHDRLLVKDA